MIRQRLFHIGFIVPLVAFVFHQVLQYGLDVQIEFLDNYLDPFCASAMACYLLNIERWYYFDELKFTWLDMIILVIFLSIISELLFPWLSDRFVSDVKDIPAFLLGGVWYMFIARKD
ncbi:MAG: hypothetical protein RIC80_13645 [Cyclobacteriaceae bacterium]